MSRKTIRKFLVGAPLATRRAHDERLSNIQGLAIFSSDSLSSTAYATEEILLVLATAGATAFAYALPIAAAITVLIGIVALSYRQLIHAYPQGGGAYSVARDQLGEGPALLAASALLIDYILTAAVSISAGVAALTSAFPILLSNRLLLAVLAVLVLVLGNLRGVRESGKIFALPTLAFIVSLLSLIAYGIGRAITGTFPQRMPETAIGTPPLHGVSLLLLLRAFSAGCTALTGIEATANGVRAFREPAARNAARTLGLMAAILATIFLGLTALAHALHIAPKAEETVVSQIAASLVGRTPLYFLVQFATALILLLAANTSFAGFPRLTAILAQDRYFPRQFQQLGSRLVHSRGIVLLSGLTTLLLIAFHADTHRLIPMYAVGVFLVFTISQWALVRRGSRSARERGHWRGMAINAVGAITTLIVLIVVFTAKFLHGAWLLLPATATLMLAMRFIHNHYQAVAAELSLDNLPISVPHERTVVILVSGVHRGTLKAVEVARTLKPAHMRAAHIELDPDATVEIRRKWERHVPDIPLDIVPSPFRELTEPLIDYLAKVERRWENDTVIVVMPEFVPTKLWHHALHNQSALAIRWALEHREDVEILDVPYRLKG